MSLFFSNEKRKGQQRRYGRPDVETLHKMECKACPLDTAKVNTPKMPPTGAEDPMVYVLGEAPGAQEDSKGEQFVGPAGKLLRDALPSKYKNRLRYNNVIRTRPPGNRNPMWQEIECCRPSIVRDIENTKPKAIFGFGNFPLNWACGVEGISAWRGRRIPVDIGNHTCWYYPMLHPAYVLRRVSEQESKTRQKVGDVYQTHEGMVFKNDIQKAFDELEKGEIPYVEGEADYRNFGDVITDVEQVEECLEQLTAYPAVAIDIETNGLRPYREGSKILTIAIGTYSKAFVFPLRHRETPFSEQECARIDKAMRKFLLTRKGTAIAHNLAFEMEWLAYFYGREILRAQRWDDTQAQAYCIDERRGVLSLDLLCLQYFGFNLKPVSNLDRANLDQECLEDVLIYNALDVKYTFALYEEQDDRLDREGLRDFYEKEALRRIPTMVLAQMRGVCVDLEETKRIDKKLRDELAAIEEDIRANDAVVSYEKEQDVEFNPNTHKHVVGLLRDRLGLIKNSGTGEEVLRGLDHPVAEQILEWRRYSKLRSTYVDKMLAKGGYVYPDGRIHTNLNTMYTATGRLSSDEPNVQNFPKRKDKWVRQQIVASPGCVLITADYGQIEPRVIAAWSGDRVLIDLLWQDYDIHQHWAERIAKAYPQILKGRDMKWLRQETKSDFVLAGFYGSEAPAIAGRMRIPKSIVERLLEEFWDTFKGVKKWQEGLIKQYWSMGYVECKTRRRRHAPLTGNIIINTPVLGTASDVVVDAMNRLSEVAQEEELWELQSMINIHDDLMFDVPEEDVDDYLEIIVEYMLNVPYSFMRVVPISIEVACGYNWADTEDIGRFATNE